MKKLTSLICVLCIAASVIAVPAAAADTNLKVFNVSLATSLSGTGFSLGTDTADMIERGTDDRGNKTYAVKMIGGESASALIYSQGWSTSASIGDNFIIETEVKADSVASGSTFSLTTRTGASDKPMFSPLKISGNQLLCCDTAVENFTVEAGKWYSFVIAIKKNPEFAVEIYHDGVKLITKQESGIDGFDAYYGDNPQLRISVAKNSTYYVGDTRLYQTGAIEICAKESVLPSTTTPLELEFVSLEEEGGDTYVPVHMDPDSVIADNITVTDLDGNVMESGDYTVTKVYDEDGKWVTGAKLSFNSPLAEDYEYTLSFNKTAKGETAVTDIMGRGISAEYVSIDFETAPPAEQYNWNGGAKLYKGCGASKTAVTTLSNGKNTVALDVKNNGNRPRQLTFVAVLYQGGKLTDMQYVTCELGGLEQTELSLTFDISNCNSSAKLKTFVWKEVFGRPLTGGKVFGGEGA